MKNQFDQELGDRLMRYAAIDSQSDEDSRSTPSTEVQFDILRLLEKELTEIGAEDVQLGQSRSAEPGVWRRSLQRAAAIAALQPGGIKGHTELIK